MSASFKGEHSQRVDAKARVSVPASFVRALEAGDPNFPAHPRPRLALVYGGSRNFIECHTIAGMARIEANILRMSRKDPAREYLRTHYIMQSQEIEVGEDGRIVLPPKARDKIDIAAAKDGADTVFAGMLDTFRIWHRPDFDTAMARQKAVAETLLPDGEDMESLLPDDIMED